MKLRNIVLLSLIFVGLGLIFFNGQDMILDDKLDEVLSEEVEDGALSVDLSRMESEEIVFAYRPIDQEILSRIEGISYVDNENIALEDLVYLQVGHWGFDDRKHLGELIVNKRIADDLLEIFKLLYEGKYPIEKMVLIDDYGGSDEKSMDDNNSSAFNYREVTGTNKLSKHSYGLAIDINPVQNPYIKNNIVLPEIGKEYIDRQTFKKGMIKDGDLCHRLFKEKGWTWGGDWKSLKDYQHFEFDL